VDQKMKENFMRKKDLPLRQSMFLLTMIGCMFLCSSACAAYIDNGDGTVTDTETGFMWQKAVLPADMVQAFGYCATLSLGGHSDWRLPTVKELSTLNTISIPVPGTTSTANSFPDMRPLNYWSSTRITHGSDLWAVLFYSGGLHSTKEREAAASVVQCVRDSD
jgi:hypothetical protein